MDLNLIKVSGGDLEKLAERAIGSPRRRTAMPLHEEAYVGPQALFNAMMPDSYLCPHLHNKSEIWMPIRNRMDVILFDDYGDIVDVLNLSQDDENYVEIPVTTYHTVVAHPPISIFFNLSQAPYDPKKAKIFPSWAPREEENEKAQKYLRGLKERISNL